MTRAPANLLAARQLLLDHLDINPGRTVGSDLDPAEVGIVGDAAHRGGYHCGASRVVPNDYSVVESSRDRAGLTEDAAALDVGQFRVTTGKGTFDLPHYSRWLVRQCEAGTADTQHIREVIYSPDGRTVRRWDRLGRRTTGDTSHLWHTHESYFRNAIKAGADLTAVKRRYLTEIGLLAGEDDDMTTAAQFLAILRDPAVAAELRKIPLTYPVGPNTSLLNLFTGMAKQLGALSGQDLVDEPAIVAGVLSGITPDLLAAGLRSAGLTPEALAAAVPDEIAQDVVDELIARLSSAPGQARE